MGGDLTSGAGTSAGEWEPLCHSSIIVQGSFAGRFAGSTSFEQSREICEMHGKMAPGTSQAVFMMQEWMDSNLEDY